MLSWGSLILEFDIARKSTTTDTIMYCGVGVTQIVSGVPAEYRKTECGSWGAHSSAFCVIFGTRSRIKKGGRIAAFSMLFKPLFLGFLWPHVEFDIDGVITIDVQRRIAARFLVRGRDFCHDDPQQTGTGCAGMGAGFD